MASCHLRHALEMEISRLTSLHERIFRGEVTRRAARPAAKKPRPTSGEEALPGAEPLPKALYDYKCDRAFWKVLSRA